MPTGRGIDAAAYRKMARPERRDMIRDASCDNDSRYGYMRRAIAEDIRDLARTRRRLVTTRTERLRRLSDFYHVMTRLSENRAIIAEYPPEAKKWLAPTRESCDT